MKRMLVVLTAVALLVVSSFSPVMAYEPARAPGDRQAFERDHGRRNDRGRDRGRGRDDRGRHRDRDRGRDRKRDWVGFGIGTALGLAIGAAAGSQSSSSQGYSYPNQYYQPQPLPQQPTLVYDPNCNCYYYANN